MGFLSLMEIDVKTEASVKTPPMPMAGLPRRRWLAWGATALVASSAAGRALAANTKTDTKISPHALRLAAAWEGAQDYQVGVLALNQGRLQVTGALDVPTRAHGIWQEKSGSLLAVARRPGDWLLRWTPGGKALLWGWIETDRAFNGHAVASLDGKTLYTTETNLETGEGVIGLRDSASLEKIDEWLTHGMDPHELLLDSDGSLMVANGGIPALPETGRLKIHMHRMDASLVRLDAATGELRGQWRLADQRLSLRHLAWGPAPTAQRSGSRLLGVALQAEHDDPVAKADAPVLAIFDGQRLQSYAAGAGQRLAGYGGSIVWVDAGFAVSCPRANGVALWRAEGQWAGFSALDEACSLAAVSAPAANGRRSARLWAGGRVAVLGPDGAGQATVTFSQALRLDNHWMSLA
ncbi:hypothetical protein AwPolaro_04200 [Polaromonas sp.]|nr:hypothetical protein AwPolaro_04200 [Polaromonas sp.]